MMMQRRRILQAIPALPMVAAASTAQATTSDLVLNCDPALVPPLEQASRSFFRSSGVRVRLFPTGPGLLVPQLSRVIQNDLICAQAQSIEAAVQAGLVAVGAAEGGWRNRLVIASRKGGGAAAAKGRIAASDPTPASDMDGPAIIKGLGLGQSAILGVIDTDDAVFSLLRGEAEAGLLHATDVRANAGLEVVSVVPDEAAPPIVCSIAVTKLARRPDPQAFVEFLMSPEGNALMREHGLENEA